MAACANYILLRIVQQMYMTNTMTSSVKNYVINRHQLTHECWKTSNESKLADKTNKLIHCWTCIFFLIPKELRADWSSLHNAASKGLVLHERRWIGESVFLDEFTGDSCRHTCTVWRNEESHSWMTTAAHGTASCVHHETYQKTTTRHNNKIAGFILVTWPWFWLWLPYTDARVIDSLLRTHMPAYQNEVSRWVYMYL